MIPKNPKSPNRPPTPSEVLREDFMEAHGMTRTALARKMGISVRRASALVSGKCRCTITAEIALLLARVFRTTPELWMRLQASCDLYEARNGRSA